ncbi:hypothetical protein CONPUDRAFT_169821 [Coniophora puteana RWD-64-598 SS2]|uniref:Uncharacterized protein n=1 Tax=Coniophora puteana (strain RWD-64-598) TaxID=741705 RepID=A0A5M3M784_CONPW|nr:uncharacterized protein CONPUDRAFT_169821 [Coniophora puteana RWD-64-598 SS2]EIW74927.1 hypothetical protein CONPUDRAFT_169821 [Coniophora puteana RWD-64-598 SS2]
MDFPFFSSYNIFRGSGNTFWHPPMLSTADRSPPFAYSPMLPEDKSLMGFLHLHMLPTNEANLYSSFLHPPRTRMLLLGLHHQRVCGYCVFRHITKCPLITAVRSTTPAGQPRVPFLRAASVITALASVRPHRVHGKKEQQTFTAAVHNRLCRSL